MRFRRKKPRPSPMLDSGLSYCVVHAGVREQDELICDFARDELREHGSVTCVLHPLMYDPTGKGEVVGVD